MRPNNEMRTIFKHDLDLLIEQVDKLADDRIARNARIKVLEDALEEIVDDLSVPTRPAPWAAHALQVAQAALLSPRKEATE